MASKVLGVLTPVLDGFYYGEIIKSICEEAEKYHMKVVIIGTSAQYYKSKYATNYVDGWIVMMDAVDQQYVDSLRAAGKPVIGINTLLDCDDYISLNNEAVVQQIIEHLLKHGHERIAYVGDNHFFDANERYQGYRKALQHYQLDYADEGFYNTLELSPEEIVKNMVNHNFPFTAIICVNDYVAYQLYQQLKVHQIQIPKDIAIIGFDNNPMSKSNKPSLSTVAIPFNEIGSKATEVLVHILNDQLDLLPDRQVRAYPIFRESCGCETSMPQQQIDDPLATFEYLNNMVARNFNLGQLMQTNHYQDIMDMTWLNHTPFRSVEMGLWHEANEGDLNVASYKMTDAGEKPLVLSRGTYEPEEFPAKTSLLDETFMAGHQAIVVIPIMQGEQELGAFGFVGLADITTQLLPLNTTYQLANFFASALKRLAMDEELKAYSKKMELISEIMYDGIWDLDLKTKRLVSQGGIHKILGYDRDELEIYAFEIDQYIHPDDFEVVKKKFRYHILRKEALEVECRFLHADGHYIWMYMTGQAQYSPSGKLIRILGSIMDITERKKAERRINELAYQDALTGLSNRFYFEEQTIKLLEEAKQLNKKVAILMLDLDHFKNVNDSFGHQAGDNLLRSVAQRIRSLAKKEYLLARIGGDEFVVVMPSLSDSNDAVDFGNKIIEQLNRPFIDGDKEHYISCSVGISIFPDHGSDAESITLFADMAMYQAKFKGRNRLQMYTLEMSEYNHERVHIEKHLRKALTKNELYLDYQPLYSIDTKKIIAVEALLRWKSSEFGTLQPMEFIPLAEETGLIIPIGEWVLKEVCQLNKRWEDQGYPSLIMSVNISPRQLNYMNFIHRLQQILRETGCRPENICLEITESTMLNDIQLSADVLQYLIDMGIKISIDDFGTGYSTLSVLKDLPIHTIKIDKSFISDITRDPKNSSLVKAMIDMSHSMSLKVVAEGVENSEQIDVLQNFDTDYLQGFYLSKPIPVERIEELLD